MALMLMIIVVNAWALFGHLNGSCRSFNWMFEFSRFLLLLIGYADFFVDDDILEMMVLG